MNRLSFKMKITCVVGAIVLVVVCLLTVNFFSSSGYYRNPLNITIEPAANFGEPRIDHFHMGADLRTKGRVGLPVYAVADGYVSEALLEEKGYGKCLIIAHNNGTSSLYAHLSLYYDTLENLVSAKQYASKSWEQHVFFKPSIFRVHKGDLVGYSGNTGTSEGPHLHFELRDTKSGDALNPLLNGYVIKDKLPPLVKGLYWYNRNKSFYASPGKIIELEKQGDAYHAKNIMYVGTPEFSLGIEANDKMNETKFNMGVYSIRMYLDDTPVFAFAMQRIPIHDTRYVNACIDYAARLNMHKDIQLLTILPGNKLKIFNDSLGDGIIRLKDTEMHTIQIELKDEAGNTTNVVMQVQRSPIKRTAENLTKEPTFLNFNKAQSVTSKNAAFYFPAGAFYDDVPFALQETKSLHAQAASVEVQPVYPQIPVHTGYYVTLKILDRIPKALRKNIVMRLTNQNGETCVKGNSDGNYIKGRFNELGNVKLLIDTVAPTIATLGWKNGDVFNNKTGSLQLLCNDNLGTVESLSGFLDGQWLLFYRKGNVFTYTFDNHLQRGSHILHVAVKDIAGNEKKQTFSFSNP